MTQEEMDRSTASAQPIPLNGTARLVLEIRKRATTPITQTADAEDPLDAIIRCIEGAPGSRQSMAGVAVMSDIVRKAAAPASTPEMLEDISDQLASLIALFAECYESRYRHDPRLARFRWVKHHR